MASSWSRCHARASRSGEMVVVRCAAPIIQVNCFEPDEVQINQAEAHTSCQRLCFRFVPPIKQRPPNPWPANHAWALPNGRWQQVNETLKAMATCQRRPIIPISFCTDNNKIMPQLDHFHAPTNQNCTSN